MKNYLRVLLTKENTSSLKLSIDIATDNVKQVLEDIEGSKQKHNVQPLEVYSPKFQEAKKSEYTGGKAGIGPFALNNAHHILTQLTKLRIASNSFTNAFDIVELGRIFDQPTAGVQKGGRILDWLSAMINAFVDIAKDPYIVRLNVNQWTYNMVSFLLRTGKGKRTFYFMSQPILKEIADEVLKTKGKFGIDNTKTPFQLEQEAVEKVLAKYDPTGSIQKKYQAIFKDQEKAGLETASLFETRMLDNGEETTILRELIKNPESFKNYNDYQVKVYFTWKAIKPYADSLANLVKYSKVDTKKTGKSFAAQDIYLDGMEEMKFDKRFAEGEIHRFFTETFIDVKTQNSIPFGMQLFSNLLIRNTDRFSKQKKTILRMLGRLTSADERSLNAVINAMESQVKAKFFNDYLRKNNISLKDMFIGGNSIAIRLNNFKLRVQRGEFPDLYIDGRYQNDFLEMLLPDMDVEYGLNFISLSQVLTQDQTIDNNLINYWRELIEHPNERVSKLFKDLAIYAFYTTGDNSTINGFFKYLPNSFREELGYVQFMQEQLDQYENSTEFSDTDVEDIFLNNWQNDFLVKPVDLYIKYQDGQESLKTIMFNQDDIVPSMISGEGNMSGKQRIKPIKWIKMNDQYLPMFSPYIKVRIGNRSLENTHVYKLVGVYEKSINKKQTFIPVYGLVSKKGYKHKGYNIYEYGIPTQFDFNKEVQYDYSNVINNQESLYEYLEDTEQYGWDILESHKLKHIDSLYSQDQYSNNYQEEDDVEDATVLTRTTESEKVLGENISSRGSEFARKLTNPGNDLQVEYKGKVFRNAEHAYQTWKSGEFDEAAYNSTAFKPTGTKPVNKATSYRTMVEIITAKLQQHPELVEGINQRGGMEYLNKSYHSVTGDLFWETQGNFMKALKEAYSIVNAQSNNVDRKTYSGQITSLKDNQVFVFGSNTQGRHGKGAALVARNNFGAVYGQAEGIQGRSFAIITKDLTSRTQPSRTPEQIKEQIHKLYEYTKQNPGKEFLVAYSASGTNLNFYSNDQMAEMFASENIPNNIVFEEGFNKLVQKYEQSTTQNQQQTTSKQPGLFDNMTEEDKKLVQQQKERQDKQCKG